MIFCSWKKILVWATIFLGKKNDWKKKKRQVNFGKLKRCYFFSIENFSTWMPFSDIEIDFKIIPFEKQGKYFLRQQDVSARSKFLLYILTQTSIDYLE